MGNHLSTLLRSPQRNLLSQEIFSLDGNLAAKMKSGFFVSARRLVPGLCWGWNSLSLAGDGGAACWRPLLLTEPRETLLSAGERFRVCVRVPACGVLIDSPKDLIFVLSATLRSCVSVCHGYSTTCCLNRPPRGQDIPLRPEKDVSSSR